MRQTFLLNVVVLGFFVLLFGSIERRRPSERLRLWIAGWLCAVAHFCILLFEPASEWLSQLVQAVAIAALMLCPICFILSVNALNTLRSRRLVGAGLALPSLVFLACAALPSCPVSVLLGIDLVGQGLAVIFLWRFNRDRLTITVPGTALLLICTQWSSYDLIRHQPSAGIPVLLMEFYAVFALLFAHDFRRRSAGVWTTIAGLLAWAAVFPVGMFITQHWPSLRIEPEIWNVPKVVVAFGMLVTLFEEELIVAGQDREQYRSLFDGNPLPMWIFDKETTRLLEANSAAVRDFGWSREDLPRLSVSDLLSGEEASPVGLVELNWRLAADETPAGTASGQPNRERLGERFGERSGERSGRQDEVRASSMRFQTRRGDEVIVEVTLQRVGFQGREARLLVTKDITEQVQTHEQLIHLANHDPLTGLPNRLLLHDRMKSALASAMRHAKKTAILCMDLDRFKQINDTYGHAAGDSCLREVADRLRQRLRSVDTAARTGGEEFMIILDDVGNRHDAERVVNDLLFSLSAPHLIEGERVHLSASIGIALFPDDGEDATELWNMADAAMYRAKQGGGNRHSFYSRAN